MRILAIADDLTGALEVGAKFASLGCAVLTRFDEPWDTSTTALVIDTETRHLDAERARERLACVLARARLYNPELIYKKTDSTLRGNIGAELAAVSAAYPERPILFAPAYPEMGRTVRHGRVFVDGALLESTPFSEDALNPVRSSDVAVLLADHGVATVLHETVLGTISDGRVHIFDGQTEADMAAVAALIDSAETPPIFCGTGSLAGHLGRVVAPDQQRSRRTHARIRSCLVVNGSRNPASERQIAFARAAGWPTASASEILAGGMPSNRTILHCPCEPAAAPLDVVARTGAMVREIVSGCDCDTLIVFGGDTAYGVVEALGSSTLYPIAEVLPGVPVSLVGNIQMITKAGGFGPEDLLPQLFHEVSEA